MYRVIIKKPTIFLVGFFLFLAFLPFLAQWLNLNVYEHGKKTFSIFRHNKDRFFLEHLAQFIFLIFANIIK